MANPSKSKVTIKDGKANLKFHFMRYTGVMPANANNDMALEIGKTYKSEVMLMGVKED